MDQFFFVEFFGDFCIQGQVDNREMVLRIINIICFLKEEFCFFLFYDFSFGESFGFLNVV